MIYMYYWLATTASIIAISNVLEKWIKEDIKLQLIDIFQFNYLKAPVLFFNKISDAFITIFDNIYRNGKSKIESSIWSGMLLCYLVFPLIQVIILVMELPGIPTEEVLTAVVFLSIGSAAFHQTIRFTRSYSFANYIDPDKPKRFRFDKNLLYASLLHAYAMCTYTLFFIYVLREHEISGEIFISTIIWLPIAAVAFHAWVHYVETIRFPVNPFRSFISSLIVILILSAFFPSPMLMFLDEVVNNNILILSYLALNFLADTISLIETRWVLNKGRKAGMGKILLLIFIDLLLSLLIYLILPIISGEPKTVILDGIFMKGEKPWFGILFWSTFSTSLLFYLFAISTVIAKTILPFIKIFEKINLVIDLKNYPIRSICLGLVIIESLTFVIYLLCVSLF